MNCSKYSFIIEFDEMTDKQIADLTDFFNNNKLKVHLLKFGCDLNKQEKLQNALDEIEKYIEEYQEERTYTDRGGFTCIDGHFLRNSDDLLQIIKKAKGK